MDTEARIEELKGLLQEQGIDVSSCEASDAEAKPTTKIAEAALKDLMVADGDSSVWLSWTLKQLSGDCVGAASLQA